MNVYRAIREPNDVTYRLVKRLSDQFFNVFVRISLYKLERWRSLVVIHILLNMKSFLLFFVQLSLSNTLPTRDDEIPFNPWN